MAMRLVASGLALCALVGACRLAPGAGPRGVRAPAEANLEHRYYDVNGASVGELLAALQNYAPEATQTGTYFARTTWTVEWHGDWTAGDDGCAIISSHTRLESQMALPRWRRATGVSVDVVADWNNFVRSLAAHEVGHVVNAVAASHAVDAELKGLKAPSCDGMEGAARAKIDSIVAVFRLRDEEYDERTRHGASQGAMWPPRSGANIRQPGMGEVIRNPPLRLPTTGPR